MLDVFMSSFCLKCKETHWKQDKIMEQTVWTLLQQQIYILFCNVITGNNWNKVI